jgi:hypothetical protein
MTSSSASDHGNPAGIAALMQNETTSKGMEANKNFAKWLSCGIQISGTFGLHHVYHLLGTVSKYCLLLERQNGSRFLKN